MGGAVDLLPAVVTSNGDLGLKPKLPLMNGDVRKMDSSVAPLHFRKGAQTFSAVTTEEFDDDEDEDSSSGDEKVQWNYAPTLSITQIDDRDVGTSDDWIPRHPDLVRLTGRHPFNCEPPLSSLMEVQYSAQSLQ